MGRTELVAPTRLEAMTRLGRALADPTRCRLLLALLEGPAYPAALAERLELTRPNVSNHLTCLRGCGLVVATPQGRQMRYELADDHLAHALSDLLDVVLTVDPSACAAPAAAFSGSVPGEDQHNGAVGRPPSRLRDLPRTCSIGPGTARAPD